MKKANTKQLRSAYETWLKSSYFEMNDAYTTWSWEKEEAWKHCQKLCFMHEGLGLKIVSKNTFCFSAGFVFYDESGKKCFAYITRDHERYCEL